MRLHTTTIGAANEGGSDPQVMIRETLTIPAAATQQTETKSTETPVHHPNSKEERAARVAAQLAAVGKSGA